MNLREGTRRLALLLGMVALVYSVGIPAQTSAQGQTPAPQSFQGRIIPVWLDTDLWTQGILIKQLNNHGESKHIQFVAAAPGQTYEYKIHYEMSPSSVPLATGGSLPTHVALVVVTDASGEEILHFDVRDTFTEKGASNHAAGEIVKRLAKILGK